MAARVKDRVIIMVALMARATEAGAAVPIAALSIKATRVRAASSAQP
jgi:hypothetical protein